ncbi:MAG: hypothetical protein AAF329_11525 [Cyanobacteria bacterium P01_A01_bin.17]
MYPAALLQVFGLIVLRIAKLQMWLRESNGQIYLRRWHGRLGNNIIQIAHAEMLSQRLGLPLSFPQHPFLSVEAIGNIHPTNNDHCNNIGVATPKVLLRDLLSPTQARPKFGKFLLRCFYFSYDIFPLVPTLADYRRILRARILPLLSYQKDASVPEETLVIHIRSGDIFSERPHPGLLPPPLSFYLEVIEKFSFSKIVVVAEDSENLCVDQLRHLIPGVKVQSSSLAEDVNVMLNAKNLISSGSSLSLSIAFASPNLCRLFVPQFKVQRRYWRTLFWPRLFRLAFMSRRQAEPHHLDFDFIPFAVENYVLMGEWKNSPSQRQLLIHHDRRDIVFAGAEPFSVAQQSGPTDVCR